MMIRKLLTIILFLFISFNNFYAIEKEILNDIFESAAAEYNVPADLLKSIAYTETRFYNVIPSGENENDMPPAYGIMCLRNDDWFGHSLTEGAKLIGAPVNEVKVNIQLNVSAAAALLSKYADELNINRNNMQAWHPVIEKYSGIPQEEVQPYYSFDVFKVLNEGTNLRGVTISRHKDINMSQFGERINPKNKLKEIQKTGSAESINSIQSADYPPAVWDPSGNFTANSITHLFAVVHDTEGSFAGSVSWLKNPAADASSHYIIRSSDGYIKQLVREKDRAWHARCWNAISLGVEHEGWVDRTDWLTEDMYQSSAALFRHFANTYGIPVDTFHIIGHYQSYKTWWTSWINNTWNPAHPSNQFDPTCNDHTDPGPNWDWQHYFDLIDQGAVTPNITASNPSSVSDTVWNNAEIRIYFDEPMAPVTENAFSISPSISGTFTWEDTNKTLVFKPDGLYDFSTKYTVTLSTQAASVFYKNIDSPYIFEFITKPDVPLHIVNSYPNDNAANISATVKVTVNFNAPIIYSSLGGNIAFQDANGNNIPLKNAEYFEVNGEGAISFSPSNPLESESVYKIIIGAGLKAINENTLGAEHIISFTTGKNNFVKGSIIEDFEEIGNWKQPDESNSTGIDESNSSLSVSQLQKIDGTNSGKLTYKFLEDSALFQISNNAPSAIPTGPNIRFGIWVYADISGNLLQLSFSNSINNILIPVDTLNWTGWKFFEFSTNFWGSLGSASLQAIQIKRLSNGADEGSIYVDEIQWRDTTTTDATDENWASTVPSEYRLLQNYPNPFNPSTVISWQQPVNSHVTLKIYDVLGNEVATLIDSYKPAGNYDIRFDANSAEGGLTSGVYFYQLQAGDFVSTKKLILLR